MAVNPPVGHRDCGYPASREDPGPHARIAAARAAARRRGLRGGRGDPEALRYSPILWISIIGLTIMLLSGLIVWRAVRYPPPPGLATPAGVTDMGGRQSGLDVGGTGSTIVEVYFDLMCTACRTVDAQLRSALDQLVAGDRIRLVWHPLGVLDDRTDPTGYSTRAANAVACAADAGKARPYASALFAQQGTAGRAGLSDDQLVDLGGPVGLNAPAFAACVRDQRYRDWVAVGDAAAAQRGVREPPAVFVNGERLEQPTARALLAAAR